METKAKRGRPAIEEYKEKRQFIQFACSDGTKQIWQSYAQNLKMSETDLFYKMTEIVSGQMGFIDWLEKLVILKRHDKDFQEIVDSFDNNKEFLESLKMVIRLSQNVLLLNPGRRVVAEKPIPQKTAKEVSENLDEHFTKRARKVV